MPPRPARSRSVPTITGRVVGADRRNRRSDPFVDLSRHPVRDRAHLLEAPRATRGTGAGRSATAAAGLDPAQPRPADTADPHPAAVGASRGRLVETAMGEHDRPSPLRGDCPQGVDCLLGEEPRAGRIVRSVHDFDMGPGAGTNPGELCAGGEDFEGWSWPHEHEGEALDPGSGEQHVSDVKRWRLSVLHGPPPLFDHHRQGEPGYLPGRDARGPDQQAPGGLRCLPGPGQVGGDISPDSRHPRPVDRGGGFELGLHLGSRGEHHHRRAASLDHRGHCRLPVRTRPGDDRRHRPPLAACGVAGDPGQGMTRRRRVPELLVWPGTDSREIGRRGALQHDRQRCDIVVGSPLQGAQQLSVEDRAASRRPPRCP